MKAELIKKALALASVEQLKEELQHRKAVERARLHRPSAERALMRAKEKLALYDKAIAQDNARKT